MYVGRAWPPTAQQTVSTLRDSGLHQVTVVRGYRKEAVTDPRILTVDNDRYADTSEVFSLARARPYLVGDTVIAYGDVLFRRYILDAMLTCDADIVVAVDGAIASSETTKDWPRDWLSADRPYVASDLDDTVVQLTAIRDDLAVNDINGEWIGLARFSQIGVRWLCEELDRLQEEGLLEVADMPLLISRLVIRHPAGSLLRCALG